MITIDPKPNSKKVGSSRAAAGSSDKGEKKTGAAGSKSSGSAGSRNPNAVATPSSIALDEEEEEEEEKESVVKLVSRKRSREEIVVGAHVAQKAGDVPIIGKQSNLSSLYKFSAEKEKEKKKAVVKPVGDKSKATETAATTTQDKEQGPTVVHITGIDQPLHEKEKDATRGKGPEVVKPIEPAHKETTTAAGGASVGGNVSSSAFAAGQAGAGSQSLMPHPPMGPKDTLDDIYYKTYTEETRGDAPIILHGVNRQRARSHDGLYHAYMVGEANTRAANHQIIREWRTMVREWRDWEKYCERLLNQV
ncbi:hypothetical protein Hanom_Chr08g00688221 [Helianthus anomalus]